MSVQPLFHDRAEAGRMLAERLKAVCADIKPLVLALPRGGVPVAFEIAKALSAELDVIPVRTLGVPGQEEQAMGAMATSGIRILNHAVITQLHISAADIDQVVAREQEEIKRGELLYRGGRRALSPEGRTVVMIDDGLATRAILLAAVRAVRTRRPKRIILAVPVASRLVVEEFRRHVDDIVCVGMPEPFYPVGTWYENFSEVSDADVRALIGQASLEHIA